MVLSAALDNGYVFLTLIAILTSVVSAVYYLGIINKIFFYKPEYIFNSAFENITLHGSVLLYIENEQDKRYDPISQYVTFKINNIVLSSSLTITVSILTLILILFIFTPQEWLSMANLLALVMFNV